MTKVGKRASRSGPRSKEIVELEQRHMAPGLQSFALYSGLAMARGEGSRIYDEDGNAYIDFIAGIAVGSRRPLPSPLRRRRCRSRRAR